MSDLHRPSEIPSVLIWGGWYGSRNIGDTAILLGLKFLLKEVNSESDIYIRALSTDPDYTATNGVTGEKALTRTECLNPLAWFRLLRTFSRPDLVIVSGGTPFFDSSHAIRTLYLLLPLVFGKPFVVFGAGVKPITSWYGRTSIPFLLKRAKAITVRDEASRKILSGLGVKDVVLTADSAFFAQSADSDSIARLLGSFGIEADESTLVVAPRLLSQERKRLYLQESMSQDLIERTPSEIAAAIDRVAARFDRVVLMAMHFYGPDSDVPLIKAIRQASEAPNLVFLDRELRPETALALFKRARLVLGMRLHSLLLASSVSTPIVGIAYEQKVTSLFTRLGMEEYCTSLFEFTTADIVARIDRALEAEDDVRQRLSSRVAELSRQVLESAEHCLQLPS